MNKMKKRKMEKEKKERKKRVTLIYTFMCTFIPFKRIENSRIK